MRVLAPLDGTQESFDALQSGLGLLAGCKPTVTLLVVMQEGMDSAPDDVKQAFDDDEDDAIFPSVESADRVLDEGQARCAAAGVATVERLCLEGKARDVILEQAAAADVLLMRALQKSNLRDRLRMASSEYLVRRAPCAVLLAKREA